MCITLQIFKSINHFMTPQPAGLCLHHVVLITLLIEMFKLPACPLHQTDKFIWSGG